MLSFISFPFLLYVDVRVKCSHARLMSLVMPCFDLCIYALFAIFCA